MGNKDGDMGVSVWPWASKRCGLSVARLWKWGLRRKWWNREMTYRMHLHPLKHFLFMAAMLNYYLAWKIVARVTFGRNQSFRRWALWTCCKDDDSHNVCGCPTGHLALDCPHHKTNCIIRAAPWGRWPRGPFADTRHIVNDSISHKISQLIHLSSAHRRGFH